MNRAMSYALAAFALAVAAIAKADDWPQFRRDANRSAASVDKLEFPLAEKWKWSTRGPQKHTPLFHTVVWKDSAFFTASSGQQRWLVCAEAGTGKVRWKKPLFSEQLKFVISDIVGPAVSPTGTVFVYDWLLTSKSGHGDQFQSDVEQSTFAVRTFNAETGEEGAFFPLAMMGANGVLPRLSLVEGVGEAIRPVPPTFSGCPP